MYNFVQKKILLLKNHQGNCQKLSKLLAQKNLSVVQIDRLSEAIAYCRERTPDIDVVLLDLEDLAVSGASVVQQLQAVAFHLPIVASIDPHEEEIAIELFQFGLQDYLFKDQINQASLLRTIVRAIQRQRYYVKIRNQQSKVTTPLRKNTEKNREWCDRFFQTAPTAMGIFDRQLRVIQINSAFAEIGDRSPEESVGKTITELLPELAERLIPKMQQVWSTGKPSLKQEIIQNIPENRQYWECSIFPLLADGGNIAAIGCVIHNISDLARSEQTLHQQWLQESLIGTIQERIRQSLHLEEVLNTAVEEVRKFLQTDRVIVYRFDSEHSGVVMAESVGNQWTKTLGMQIQQGCFWDTYFPMYQQGWVCAQDNISSSASETETCPVDLFTQFEIKANLVVPILQDDRLWGLLIAHDCQSPRQWDNSEIEALRNISWQLGMALKQSALFAQAQSKIQSCQNVEFALRESQQQLQLALTGSALGLWDWNLATGEIYVSSEWKSILGYQPHEIADRIDSWQPLIHPQDLLQMKRLLNAHLKGKSAAFEAECRMRSKSGEWKWIGCYGQVSARDSAGNPLRIVGTNKDISDRKQATFAIERERQQLHQIVAHAPVAMAILDREMRYLAHSEKWLATYGLVGQKILDRCHYEVFPDLPAHWLENYQQALQGEIISIPEECWQRANGEKIYLRRSIHPWYTLDGQVGGIAIASDRIDQLVEAREQALAAVRFKSLFFANMSHEIRTPMNGVLAMSDLLLQTPLNPEQLDFVQTLKVSGNHLLSIINDLLDFSKLEAAQMRLELHEFDLNECLENVINLLAPQANAKGLQLALIVDPDVPRQPIGDDLRLRQILTNLVSNAIKFTEMGEVIVYVEPKKSRSKNKRCQQQQSEKITLKFSVKDTGVGISRADRRELFQAFAQVHQTSRKYGGTGLGLAICKQFVELMGGQIGVKSKPGEGSTFWFTATLALANTTANQTGISLVSRAEKMSEIKSHRQILAGKKILIIDNNTTNETVVRLAATTWGIEVEVANNKVTALTNLCSVTSQANPYDAVLVDWQVLKGDRDFRAQLMRIQPILPKTQFVLMISTADRHQAKPLVGLRFSDELLKPITDTRFKQTMLKLLGVKVDDSPSIDWPKSETKLETRILVVEDTEINQKVIRHQLNMLGYMADMVSNGQEALNKLLEKDYDLIFMDCQMPVLDGYETTRLLRKREAASKSKIRTVTIGLTAYGINDANPDGSGLNNREKCLAAGMDDYLSKPVSVSDLDAAIKRWTLAPPEPLEIGENLAVISDREVTEVTKISAMVDRSQLGQITRGNPELQQELLQMFIQQAETNLANINTGLSSGDLAMVLANAHQLKGASSNVAVMVMPELAAELEYEAKQNNVDRSIALMQQLQQELEKLKQAIGSDPNLSEDLTNANVTTTEPETTQQPAKLAIVPEPKPQSETVPIDFDRLHKLSGGNSAFESQLLQAFVGQVETYLDALIEAAAAKNYLHISHKFSQIKAASQNVGVLKMPEIADKIEAEIKLNNFTAIEDQVNQLQQILEQVKKFASLGVSANSQELEA